jgi:hypothetical protein
VKVLKEKAKVRAKLESSHMQSKSITGYRIEDPTEVLMYADPTTYGSSIPHSRPLPGVSGFLQESSAVPTNIYSMNSERGA